MGMTCSLHRATEAEIARLRKSPEDVNEFLFPLASTPPLVKAPPLPGLAGWIMRLLPISELIVDPNWVPPELTPRPGR